MKVRQGFVSNSSSSSFVLALPQDWEVTDKQILGFYEDDIGETGGEKEFIKKFKQQLKTLKGTGEIYYYENPVYYAIGELTRSFRLAEIGSGADEFPTLVNVTSNKIGKKIIKIAEKRKS